MSEKDKNIQPCDQCGLVRDTEAGLCATCLRGEICHDTELLAARADCGCRGGAARALQRLQER